jgi:hypothetical protein
VQHDDFYVSRKPEALLDRDRGAGSDAEKTAWVGERAGN